MTTREKNNNYAPVDMYLVLTTICLICAGILLIIDARLARTGSDIWSDGVHQLVWAVAGLGVMTVVTLCKIKWFQKLTPWIMLASIALLILVLVPGIGTEVNGSVRWIRLGPINIQPSEIAKIAIVLYLAFVLSKARFSGRSRTSLIGPLAIIGLMLGLIVKEDLGTAIALSGTVFLMLFVGGYPIHKLAALALAGVGLIALMIKMEPYRMERINTWLNPFNKLYAGGYQPSHSLMAVGTGGIYGVGLFEGREKHYLPAAQTDYIFATLSEEAGLIGAGLLILGYVIFTCRGLHIARKSKSTYGTLIAAGVTAAISLQSIINTAVVTNSIPSTGVPLPFISYGGSALVTMMTGVGILLCVSRHVNIDTEDKTNESSSNRRGNGRTHISRNKRRTSNSSRRYVR